MKTESPVVQLPLEKTRQTDVVCHPLDDGAQRKTMSLGDLTGLTKIGVHLNVLAAGAHSTVPHYHKFTDEFIYIIQGQGLLNFGDEKLTVKSGDFVGLPAHGPAHSVLNNGIDELSYIVGGNRAEFDVCDYPSMNKRLFVYSDKSKRQLDFFDVEEL